MPSLNSCPPSDEPDGAIRGLLRAGESQTLEFKSTARYNMLAARPDKKMEHVVVKTVCGFLNAEGGTLLIGVDDDGQVVGLEKDLSTLGRKPNLDGYELWLRRRLDDDLSITSRRRRPRVFYRSCCGTSTPRVSYLGRECLVEPWTRFQGR